MDNQLELNLELSPSIEVLSFTPRQIKILNERGIRTIDSLVNSEDTQFWGLRSYLICIKWMERYRVHNIMEELDEMGIEYPVDEERPVRRIYKRRRIV